MAQLSNDCFAVGDRPIPIDEAIRTFAERIRPVTGVETVATPDGDGRVLAEDVIAKRPLPAFTNSAVDGYAVRHDDLHPDRETTLPLAGRIMAGPATSITLAAHTAMRIFTGAAMPSGADTVFMQEDVSEHVAPDGSVKITLPPGLKRGANMRPLGEEHAVGGMAIPAGVRLQPAHLALAAGVGATTLAVRRRLRVALFSTGDELTEVSDPGLHGTVIDTNRPMLKAMLARAGCAVTDGGILSDRPQAIREALVVHAANHDLLLTSGGVSTGEADFIKDVVATDGRLDHWRFAMKPGRPLALGVLNGTAFAGLPGNPAAVFVTFAMVVRPLIAALSGERYTLPTAFSVRLAFVHRKKRGREEFQRARLVPSSDGWLAHRHATEGAGIISSLTMTDGLLRLPMDVEDLQAGSEVPFLPYSTLLT